MATWDDVRRLAFHLPEVAEEASRDTLRWTVHGKLFVWERPLRKSDLAALGPSAPEGPILGARVADEGVKHALIADNPSVYFTTPHFTGYATILIRLLQIAEPELSELITDAWLCQAPKRTAKAYLQSQE